MAGKPPGTLGPCTLDGGTTCLAQLQPPGTTGMLDADAGSISLDLGPPLGVLEELRQQTIIGIVLGIRKGLTAVNPMWMQGVANDESAVYVLLGQGAYQRAFEVATGFEDYFRIWHEGERNQSSGGEDIAVMLGHATGANQAVEAAYGESRAGKPLQGVDRVMTGLDALSRIASTVMTVMLLGRLGTGLVGKLNGSVRVVSPTYRIAGRDIVVVETSVGNQTFYRSSGANSGMPGEWLPVDEIRPADGWFNKTAYVSGEGLSEGQPFHRFGSNEFARISEKLGRASIPRGQVVPAGTSEVPEMTLNRILDFFNARITPTTTTRPIGR